MRRSFLARSIVAGGRLVILCAVANAFGQQPAPGGAVDRLPDWSGIWLSDHWPAGNPGGTGASQSLPLQAHPPYNPEWEARFQAMLAAKRHFKGGKSCVWYFPGVMDSPFAFEILITRAETAMSFEDDEIRHILTDGRSHPAPDDRWPTPWGDSVGHWEGTTLVIDTIAVAKDPSPFSPMVSRSVHYEERLRMVGKDKLEDRLTISDPAAFIHPWTVTLSYTRVKNQDRIINGDCTQNDRNPITNGVEGLAPADSAPEK